jgi:putative intracellular protease/amidase
MATPKKESQPPTKYAAALFDGFQALDVFGPIDILNIVSRYHPLELCMLANSHEAVSTLHNAPSTCIGQQVVPTHTFTNAPRDIEVLLVPGGMGTRDLGNTQVVVDFVKSRFPKLRYLLTVCTGSAIAAQAGVLDGKRATSNKKSFSWVRLRLPARAISAANICKPRSWPKDRTSTGFERHAGWRIATFGHLPASLPELIWCSLFLNHNTAPNSWTLSPLELSMCATLTRGQILLRSIQRMPESGVAIFNKHFPQSYDVTIGTKELICR